MKRPAANFRYRLFGALARLDEQRPWQVLAAAIALAVLCVWYTIARLEFRTGQDDLISADTRDSRNYLRYMREFPDLDGVIVVIRTEPTETQAEQFADSLAKRLNADKLNVKSVFYRIDPGLMGDRALLYLDTGALKTLAARISLSVPLLRAYAADPRLVNLFGTANRMLDAAGPSPMAPAAHTLLDPVLMGMLASPSAASSSPWSALMPQDDQSRSLRDTYLSSANGKYLLMHVAPAAGAANGPDPVAGDRGPRRDRAHIFCPRSKPVSRAARRWPTPRRAPRSMT